MKLICPECRSAVPAGAIDLFADVAECRSCKTHFAFEALMAKARRPQQKKPPVAQPPGFAGSQDAGGLTINWPAPYPQAYAIGLAFALLWLGLIATGGYVAVSIEHMPPLLIGLLSPFLIPHVIAGFWLLYNCLDMLIGNWRLSLSPLELYIRHWPIPVSGKIHLDPGKIAQLFCRAERRWFRSSPRSYQLCAWLKSGHEVILASFESYDQGAWIEQQVEAALGIADRGVRGEGVVPD